MNNNTIIDMLNESRIIFINGEINAEMSNYVITKLMYLDSLNHDDISIYINTQGGSVADGLAIVDAMKLVKSKVNTIGYGTIASMGSVILASGEKRSCMEHARCLIHQMYSGIQGSVNDVEIAYNNMIEIKNTLIKVLSEKVRKSAKQVEKDCERDKWMNAREALDYGLIDEIL